jgi:hypothetical protein
LIWSKLMRRPSVDATSMLADLQVMGA